MHEFKTVWGVMEQSSGPGDESGRKDEPIGTLAQSLPELSWSVPESGKTFEGSHFKNFVEQECDC